MKITSRLQSRSANARAERPITIVCLGDSVTHGCFDVFINMQDQIDTIYQPENSYSAILQTRLRELYPAAAPTVINAGISGDNAVGGRSRIERDVLSYKPDLVIVDFGLNDSMNPDVKAGVQEYSEAMRDIFQSAQTVGAEAMLLTPNFMCQYVARELKQPALREMARAASEVQSKGILLHYVEAARQIAAELNLPVADAYLRWQQMSDAGVDMTAQLSNHINHPSAAMHGLFAEEILRAIFSR